jgi:D-3-phosphoglycerate dehydrogenase
MKSLKDVKILLGPSTFAAQDQSPIERLLESGCEIIRNPFGRKLTRQELIELLPGVKGLIAGLEILDEDVMQKSDLKIISRCGSGLSNVDMEAAKKRGIRVYNTPFGPTRAVAELTVGCLLSLIRQVPQMDRALHGGRWDKRIGRQLKGMNVLVIGYGRIGQAVAKLLRALEAEITVCDPGFEKNETSFVVWRLEDALPMADVVVLHASGEARILGRHEICLMKRGAFILNGARGELVDEEALMDALDSGQVAGAWLDTFSKEPYEGSLANYEQVILTPHIGSYTYEGRQQMELDAADNLIRGFQEGG